MLCGCRPKRSPRQIVCSELWKETGWSHASVRRASPLRLKRILFFPVEFLTQSRFSTQSVNRSVISLLAVTTPLSIVPRPTDAGCPVGAGGFLVRLLTRGEITSLTHVEWGHSTGVRKVIGDDIGRNAFACGPQGESRCWSGPALSRHHGSRWKRTPVYPNAAASRLEHSSTKLAVVRARNPLETMSWLRMLHLPLRCSSEFIKAFRIFGRNDRIVSWPKPGQYPELPSVQTQALDR
jgi:hypothetical protein